MLAAGRIVAHLASRRLSPDQVADVGVLAVLAAAALGAGHPVLEALAVVLEAAGLLAVAAARGGQAAALVVRGGRGEVDLGFDEIEQFFALLIRHSILAASALALVGAEQASSQAVAVELEAAGALAVAGLVRCCVTR